VSITAVIPGRATRISMNPAPSAPPELVLVSQDVLLQGLSLLFKLSDRTYSRFTEVPYSESIGGHYRLVIEQFQCVVRSIRSGEINYDVCAGSQRLETDVTYTTIAICDVLRALKEYDDAVLNRACKVMNTLPDGMPPRSFVDTTVGCELAYCVGLAIHHYAMVRAICGKLGVEVPAEFGVARPASRYAMGASDARLHRDG